MRQVLSILVPDRRQGVVGAAGNYEATYLALSIRIPCGYHRVGMLDLTDTETCL